MNESDTQPVTTGGVDNGSTVVDSGAVATDVQRNDAEQGVPEHSTTDAQSAPVIPAVPSQENQEEVKQSPPGEQGAVTGAVKKTRAPRKPAAPRKAAATAKNDDKEPVEYIDTTTERQESELPRVGWKSMLVESDEQQQQQRSPVEREQTATTPNGIAKPDKPGLGRGGDVKRLDLDEEFLQHFKPAEFPGGGKIFGRNNIAQQALQRARERMNGAYSGNKSAGQASQNAGTNNMNYQKVMPGSQGWLRGRFK